MSTQTIDTKLMDNYLASARLPAIHSFAGCFDEARFPMLFYVDSDRKDLYLVHRDPVTGQSAAPINLSSALGITKATQHIALSQNASGHTAIAVGHSNGNGGTSIMLFKPALPNELKKPGGLEACRLRAASTATSTNVVSIAMTDLASEHKYPHVALVQGAPDSQSIQQLKVDLVAGSWDFDASFAVPETPSAILDLSWTTLGRYAAMWVLASVKTATGTNYSLNAYYFAHGGISTRQVTLPDGLSNRARISCVTNPSGKQDLLLLGKGLHHYRASDLGADGAIGTAISSNALLDHVGQSSINQTAGQIRLWFQSHPSSDPTAAGTMCYNRLAYSDDQSLRVQDKDLKPTPLTSRHLQGQYSCLVNPPNDDFHDQHFMFKDQDGEFQVASQSPSGRWHKTLDHFSVPVTEKLLPLKTYTTTISFHDPLARVDQHDVTISSKDTTSAIINGKRQYISPSMALHVPVRPNGKLFILHEPNNLAVPILTITADVISSPIVVDPVAHIQANLTVYDTADKLTKKHVMSENGKLVPLIDPQSGVDVHKAASNLKSLGLRAAQIHEEQRMLAESGEIRAESLGDFLDDGWNWIEEEGEKAVRWVQEEGKAMLQFAYDLGDGLRHIAINTWHDVVRVAGIIFDGLKVAWNIVKALVGALFNWVAVMEAQQAISHNMKACVAYMQEISVPVLGALLKWVAQTFFGVKIEYPSIIDIIAFVFAIVKVEIEVIADITIETNLISLFPSMSTTLPVIQRFFGESVSASAIAPPARIELMAFAVSDSWKRYSLACAIMHPIAATVKALISPVTNLAQTANAIIGFDGVQLPLVEKIEIAMNAFDIAFSVPAFDSNDRAHLGPEYAGYAISSLSLIIRGLNKLLFKVDVGIYFWESFAMLAAGAKLVLYSISLASQLDAAQDEDTKTDIRRAIGSLICSTTSAIGTWVMLGPGADLIKKQPEVGWVVVGAGGLVNTLSEFADFGVDWARGSAEYSAAQAGSQKGQYNGMKR